jgi:hypothetical protein
MTSDGANERHAEVVSLGAMPRRGVIFDRMTKPCSSLSNATVHLPKLRVRRCTQQVAVNPLRGAALGVARMRR